MKSLINCISESLNLDQSYVASIIWRSDYYYKDYTIPKKDGNRRKIAQASPELKSLQYWVKKNIFTFLPVSTSAFAYNCGDSIQRHVTYHKSARFIFHTDIKDFFPSITTDHFAIILQSHSSLIQEAGYWYEDTCEVISRICFRRNHLCIGTVSSPAISNIIMYTFDETLHRYCDEHGYRYSRYADDIYISSHSFIPQTVKNVVEDQLQQKGFIMNPEKTWFKSKKCCRRVTGLILTENGRISVGSEMRRTIKKMIYNRIVNGLGDPDVILGYLAFLKDVEPAVYNRYLIKYATYCDGDVIVAIKSGPSMKAPCLVAALPDI